MNITMEMVRSAANHWADAVNSHDIDRIVTLYSEDAVLWGTFARNRKTERSSLRDYFSKLCSKPCLRTEFIEQDIRIDGTHAFNSGSYLFGWIEAGYEVIVPARFSMAYRLGADGPVIVDHHSSLFPPENFNPEPYHKK